MNTKTIFPGLAITFLLLMTATQSCHSRYDEGSEEGHYDTVQNRNNDHTMSKQQHDGLQQANRDTTGLVDSMNAKD